MELFFGKGITKARTGPLHEELRTGVLNPLDNEREILDPPGCKSDHVILLWCKLIRSG